MMENTSIYLFYFVQKTTYHSCLSQYLTPIQSGGANKITGKLKKTVRRILLKNRLEKNVRSVWYLCTTYECINFQKNTSFPLK